MTDLPEVTVVDDDGMSSEEMRAEIIRLLRDYQRRQMRLRLIGPGASFIMHLLIILLLQLVIVNETKEPDKPVAVQIVEMEVKELQEEVLIEIEKVVDKPVVESVEVPDIAVETITPTTNDVVSVPEFTDVSAEMQNALPGRDFGDVSSYDDVLFALDSAETPLKIASPTESFGLPSAYQGRATEASRAAGRAQYGGSDATEMAVMKALRWLRDNQNPDGSWSKSDPKGMTPLGLLAFMAHGEGFDSEEFGDTVQRACQRLYEDMMAVSEDSPPLDANYPVRNGMMTYALAEAYAITKIPKLKTAMEKGLRVIVKRQQPLGGWDSQYTQGSRWDLTATTWQMQALKAGYTTGSMTPGVAEALIRGAAFLKDTAWRDGNFQWVPLYRGDWGIQGCGVLCLQITGHGRSKEAKTIVDQIHDHGSDQFDALKKDLFWEHNNPYYDWYYETQVMFNAGNNTWRQWNKGFSKALIENQQEDGHWEIPGANSQRVEVAPYKITTLNCLSLQIYYRYLPSYQEATLSVRPRSTLIDDALEPSDLQIKGSRNP